MLLGVAVQGIYYSVFIYLPLFLKTVRHLSIIGTASYTWAAVAGSFLGYALAGYLHDAIGRRRAFSLYFLGAAAAIALFTKMPVSGTMMGLSITFLLGFFASGQAAGLGAYLAELFPTAIRATGQGFAYNVGRGLAAAAPTAVATASGSLGLANSILLIGCIAATLGLLVVWTLPETKGLAIRSQATSAPAESRAVTARPDLDHNVTISRHV
jgi:MFS family permease